MRVVVGQRARRAVEELDQGRVGGAVQDLFDRCGLLWQGDDFAGPALALLGAADPGDDGEYAGAEQGGDPAEALLHGGGQAEHLVGSEVVAEGDAAGDQRPAEGERAGLRRTAKVAAYTAVAASRRRRGASATPRPSGARTWLAKTKLDARRPAGTSAPGWESHHMGISKCTVETPGPCSPVGRAS